MGNLHCPRIDHIANELIRSHNQRIELASHPHRVSELNNINSDIAQLYEEMDEHRLQCPFCRLGGTFSGNREPAVSAHTNTITYVA